MQNSTEQYQMFSDLKKLLTLKLKLAAIPKQPESTGVQEGPVNRMVIS